MGMSHRCKELCKGACVLGINLSEIGDILKKINSRIKFCWGQESSTFGYMLPFSNLHPLHPHTLVIGIQDQLHQWHNGQ